MFDPETMRTFTISDGLPADNSSVLLLDREGGLWIGTGGLNQPVGSGLARFDISANDASDRRMQTWTRTDGLLINHILGLYEDSQGTVWIGTAKGLNRYNGKGMTHFTEEDGIPSERIFAITADKDGALWIGVGNRLYRYVPTFPSREGLGVGFPAFTQVGGSELHVEGDDVITALYVDAAGHLWVGLGVFNGGKGYLFRYDGQRFTRFSAEDGAPSTFITKISQDLQSRIWVGTLLGGVYVYDGKRFITPATLRQISTIYDLFHDRQGNTWLATNGGAVKIGADWQPESGGALMRTLTTADGLPHNEVRCLLEDKAGHLWFGTREGLTRYTPSTTPAVHIEQVVFADQTVQQPKEVKVSAAAKRVVVHYNAPSFRTPPHQMQYLVKLEGRDSDWRGCIK
ncbi:hypothetical protein FJZ31_26990 [Candidatus Poribacteria bacterium]|nr:hypothetical protein [Candidatus Poribacteria bacterium]